MKYDTPGRRVWRILSPILVYYGITIVISFITSFIVSYQVMASTTATDMNQLMEEIMMKALEVSVPVTFISGLACLPFFGRMIKKDSKLRKLKGNLDTLKKWKLVYCALAGIVGCVAGSLFVTISQIGTVFSGYEEVSENIFSQNLALQLVAIGLITPFVEEMLFRGLIYKRLKDYSSMNIAMIASSVIFGLTHGNLIQAFYGFAMGLLLAFVYEKYQTIAAPLICHGAANLISIILQLLNISVTSIPVAGIVILVCLVILYFMLRQIQSSVNVELKSNPEYIDVTIDSDKSDTFGGYPFTGSKNPSGDDDRNDSSASTDDGGQKKYSVEDYYPKQKNDDED